MIGHFDRYFDVVLGLNEKEAVEIAEVCGVKPQTSTPEALAETAALLVLSKKLSAIFHEGADA